MPIIPCARPMEGFTQSATTKDFLVESFYRSRKWEASSMNFLVALMNGKECELWFTNEDKTKNNFKDIVGKCQEAET